MIEKLASLEQKDYNVQVKTNFKGVEFAREMNNAQAEYSRRIRK
jgi:hypothetical protein